MDYQRICNWVRERGHVVSPRGMETREVIAPCLNFRRPELTLLKGCNRRLNARFAAVEALQLIGGFHDPDLMRRALPAVDNYADNGVHHGAYGPRVGPQLGPMVQRLRDDPSSRQAVVQVWDWARDLAPQAFSPKDIPCTLFFQFIVRDNALTMLATMRSNDVWKGLSYDAFQFSQLYWSVHNALWRGDLKVGAYLHLPQSLHLYASDYEAVDQLSYMEEGTEVPVLKGIGWPGMSIKEIQQRAQLIARGIDLDYTPTERWFADRVRELT